MSQIVVRAPHDRSELGHVEVDTPSSIDVKAHAASAAMRVWARLGPMARGERLLAIERDTRAELASLATDLSLEQGKTVREAELELDRYLGPFRQYSGIATVTGGLAIDLGGGTRGLVERGPVGVVAAIVPWNFPTSLFGTKLAPALAAGCGFLIKPAETTPLITRRLVAIAQRHLPEGLLDTIIGGPDIGRTLIEHEVVARVAFTGSTAVGREVAAHAGRNLTQVSLELGGADPFVLLEDADPRAAVRALMGTRFYNAGQVCVAPKRLIVRQEIADEIIDLLTERIGRIVPGPGTVATSTMGPLHTERTRDALEHQVADAADHGARIIGGGRPSTSDTADGWFVSPSLLVDPGPDARVRTEETFGPALTIIRTPDDDTAVRLANETPYGLGASVWSGNHDRAFALARRIDAGYTWINHLGRVYDELPFGGVKASGFGREHGIDALESFLVTRSFVYPTAG